MQLPVPALTFTLPSIHDSNILDCRVYHPLSLSSAWRPKHCAIVAHPYAPLGGSYDDPIVEDVASQLLHKGFIVGTFNFRGAGRSAGRTSWTAKPERDDYASMIGFLVYYIHHLDASRPDDAGRPVLLLAGYSYGAMITTQLPPLEAIIASFATPSTSCDAGQIRSRAESLALQQREILHAHSHRGSLRVGEGGSPRKSRDSWRRSLSIDDAEEKLRKSMRDFREKTLPRHSSSHPGSPSRRPALPPSPPEVASFSAMPDLIQPRPAHLLISPLQGIITHLATMSRSPGNGAADAKLWQHPTLAVYGDGDGFVPVGKLRPWTTRMERMEGSNFRGREIKGAGHFWIEEGVLARMAELIDDFVRELVG